MSEIRFMFVSKISNLCIKLVILSFFDNDCVFVHLLS